MNDMHIVVAWECRILSRCLLKMREERKYGDYPVLNALQQGEIDRIGNRLRVQGGASGNWGVSTKLDATAIYYIATFAVREGHTGLSKVVRGMARVAGIDVIEQLSKIAE